MGSTINLGIDKIFRILFSLGACVAILGHTMAHADGLGAGINMYRWQGQAVSATPKEINDVRALGMQSIRLPFDPTAVWDSTHHALRPDRLAQLRKVILNWRAAGFVVILDAHPDRSFKSNLFIMPGAFGDFNLMWRSLSIALQDLDTSVYFEVLNEPGEDYGTWWRRQLDLIRTVHSISPTRMVVASARHGSGIDDLVAMRPYKVDHVIYTFHFYEPMSYTHQGAWWEHGKYPSGVTFPTDRSDLVDSAERTALQGGNSYDTRVIARRLAKVRAWATAAKVNVFCGEYGAIVTASNRAAYLKDVSDALAQDGFAWFIWSYSGDFAVVDKTHGQPDRFGHPL